jgi:hypothetical protein
MRRCLLVLVLLALTACGDGTGGPTQQPDLDEAGFWELVEDARLQADGDPEAMAEDLTARLADADEETLRGFQERLVEASSRLYTWPHRHAAEMICGFVSDDVFTDWRSWVIAMGRDTFERIAENPDRLADVEDLSGGREGAAAEWFGSAVSEIWFARYGYEREDFPILEPFDAPAGEQLTDRADIRASLPRLAARIPD